LAHLQSSPDSVQVWQHVPVSRLVFGLDANTHEKKVDGKAHGPHGLTWLD
jgi:hypothetical protein